MSNNNTKEVAPTWAIAPMWKANTTKRKKLKTTTNVKKAQLKEKKQHCEKNEAQVLFYIPNNKQCLRMLFRNLKLKD